MKKSQIEMEMKMMDSQIHLSLFKKFARFFWKKDNCRKIFPKHKLNCTMIQSLMISISKVSVSLYKNVWNHQKLCSWMDQRLLSWESLLKKSPKTKTFHDKTSAKKEWKYGEERFYGRINIDTFHTRGVKTIKLAKLHHTIIEAAATIWAVGKFESF